MRVSRRSGFRALVAFAAATIGGARRGRGEGEAVVALEFAIAGGAYYGLGAALATLVPGERLELRREPGNASDRFAIIVRRADGTKLGYVPRAANQTLARLIDAGWRADASVAGFLDLAVSRTRASAALGDVAYTTVADGEPRVRATLRAP